MRWLLFPLSIALLVAAILVGPTEARGVLGLACLVALILSPVSGWSGGAGD